jgi:hypothetical protein
MNSAINNQAINDQQIPLKSQLTVAATTPTTNENGIRVISKTASSNKNTSHNGNNNGGQPKYKVQQGFIAVLKVKHFFIFMGFVVASTIFIITGSFWFY